MQIKKNRGCKKKLKRELKNTVHKQKERGSKKRNLQDTEIWYKRLNKKTHNFQKRAAAPQKAISMYMWGEALEREKESEPFQISPSCLVWLIYPEFSGIYEGKI